MRNADVRRTDRASRRADLVSPNPESRQCIRAEGRRDGDVCGVATACNQDPADMRHVVARVERIPLTAEVGFKPRGKITGWVGLRRADVTQISTAVASRYVQCAADSDA
jgi:hypothetical protein